LPRSEPPSASPAQGEEGAKRHTSTFVPLVIEPSGLFTPLAITRIIAVDSGISRHLAPDHPRFPASMDSRERDPRLCTSITPCPRAAGPPTGRSPLPAREIIASSRRKGPPLLAFRSARPFLFSFAQIRRLRGGRTLTRASNRAIARHARTHPHSKRRHQRRRHILQRQAAVPANFHGHAFHTQPVSSSGAFRIQTLHGTAGQMLHRVSNEFRWGTGRSRTARILRAAPLCVKRKPTQLVGARFPEAPKSQSGRWSKSPPLLRFALIT
jgi:hypothetical protein